MARAAAPAFRDLDAVLDGLDNCPGVANDDQQDSDSNGVGDACHFIPEPEQVLMLMAGVGMRVGLERRRARQPGDGPQPGLSE